MLTSCLRLIYASYLIIIFFAYLVGGDGNEEEEASAILFFVSTTVTEKLEKDSVISAADITIKSTFLRPLT